MSIQNLVLLSHLVLKKKQILTLIKGRNPVANLQKTNINNTNVDLVNDNVYKKFGLNLSIRSQDIEQKPNSDVNQGPLLCCKFANTMIYITNVGLVNDYVYTKFGLKVYLFSRY